MINNKVDALVEQLQQFDNEQGYKLEYLTVKEKLTPVIRELISCGDISLEHLHKLIEKEETWSCLFALKILKEIENKKSIHPLIDFLKRNEDSDYLNSWKEAMFALNAIGEAVEPLLKEAAAELGMHTPELMDLVEMTELGYTKIFFDEEELRECKFQLYMGKIEQDLIFDEDEIRKILNFFAEETWVDLEEIVDDLMDNHAEKLTNFARDCYDDGDPNDLFCMISKKLREQEYYELLYELLNDGSSKGMAEFVERYPADAFIFGCQVDDEELVEGAIKKIVEDDRALLEVYQRGVKIYQEQTKILMESVEDLTACKYFGEILQIALEKEDGNTLSVIARSLWESAQDGDMGSLEPALVCAEEADDWDLLKEIENTFYSDPKITEYQEAVGLVHLLRDEVGDYFKVRLPKKVTVSEARGAYGSINWEGSFCSKNGFAA